VEGVSTWQVVVGLLLLLGSAFASGTETALTALGDARARQLVESGGRRARMLAVWVASPERVLSTLLIGNTLFNIGAGALAGDAASDVAKVHGWSQGSIIAIATALTTSVILFLGEIIPKTLAKRHPVQVALATIPVVQLVYWVMWPLTTGLVRVTNAIVVALGGARTPMPAVTSAEIEYLIEMGTREGVLDEVKEELLNSVLEFADRVVKEVMVPRTRMVAIDRDASPEEILRIVTENPYSRMPVYRDSIDNIVGILLVKEIVPELAKGSKGVLAALDQQLKPPFFVPEQMKISRLLKEMQKRKTHLAIVVDEFGGTSGLATLEDVIEEIVGEIQDEGDVEAAPVREVSPGVYLADASVPLRELETFLNEHAEEEGEDPDREVRFPDEGDYETLGGFVTATAGRVPAVGALVAWDGLTFTVRGGDERRVTRVEIARRRQANLPEERGRKRRREEKAAEQPASQAGEKTAAIGRAT
jgi:CBS domain containing-hemolysin-like protein